MRRSAGAVVVIVLSVAPFGAHAQDPLAALRGLAVGTPVIATTVSGVLVEGEAKAATADQFVVVTKTGEERQIAVGELHTVRALKRDSAWQGLVAGAALGFSGGAGLGAAWFHGSGRYGAKPPGYRRDFIVGSGVLGSVVGALIGWRVDAARVRSSVVYQAPSIR
ncbi:MAG: hypothetical protein Q8T13_02405 [Acidobacteriota bacterium]|nr:hypothetical protein [Acidobacteriota bacterium]